MKPTRNLTNEDLIVLDDVRFRHRVVVLAQVTPGIFPGKTHFVSLTTTEGPVIMCLFADNLKDGEKLYNDMCIALIPTL